MRPTPASVRRAGRLVHVLALLIAVGISASPAMGQDAAYEAWTRVFDAINPGWRGEAPDGAVPVIGREDLDVLSDYASGPVRPPTARERAAFSRLETIAPLLADAADQRTFDAGIDWSQGFGVLLPHLSAMRQSARCLRALSHRAIAEGDAGAAAMWTGRLAGTAGQVSQDGTLIGSLVGGAIFASADEELDWLAGSGAFDAESARAALEAMGWLHDQDDPFQVLGAMQREREIMSMEMTRLADGLESGDDGAIELLTNLFGVDDFDPSSLSPEDVREQANLIHDIQSRMIDAAADPDRQRGLEAMRLIEAEIDHPDMPALAAALLPAMGRVLETRLQLETTLADRIRLLDAIASGRVSPSDAVNAAILWERLGTIFETLPGSVQVAGLTLVEAAPTAERLAVLVSRAAGEAADDLRSSDDGRDAPGTGLDGDGSAPLARWWTGTADREAEIREVAAIAAAVTAADFPAAGGPQPSYRVGGDELARLRGAGRGLLIDATARLRVAAAPSGTTHPIVDGGSDERAGDEVADALRPVDAETERAAAADEVVAMLALVHDLLADPALAHVVLAADLVTGLDGLLRSEVAAPMLADATHRDRIITALTAVPRAISLGAPAAGRADLELFADRRTRYLDADRSAHLRERLAALTADRGYALLLTDSGLAVRPARPTIGEPPEPITPWADPEGYETGYRPLRLIASLEGVHGPDQVLTTDGTGRDRVSDAINGPDGETPPDRITLDRLIPIERFPLERHGATALATIVDLDDFLAGIGRHAAPAEAEAQKAR